MTNVTIIETHKQKLAKAGAIKYTGRMISAVLPSGERVEVAEIEEIHTFAAWKARGYKVNKGEHAVAQFAIWKKGKDRTETDKNGKEVKKEGRMFLKNSFFFSASQVTKIK